MFKLNAGEPIESVRKLAAEHGANLALVVNHSGGKDSQRMLGLIREEFPAVKTYAVMADTGFEHIKPVSAEDFARASVARFGLDLTVVRNPNKTYLSMVEKRGKFPSASTRQCTSDLKRGPIAKFIRHLPERVIVNCTGIRAAESSNRAKQQPWKFDQTLSAAGRQVWNWMPIFWASLNDVLSWHWQAGMPLHPVYIPSYHQDGTTGGYLRRLSCRLCIFSTKSDIMAIYQNDREAFNLVSDLERQISFTMRADKSLIQIIEQNDQDGRQYGSEELLSFDCAPLPFSDEDYQPAA